MQRDENKTVLPMETKISLQKVVWSFVKTR